MKIAIASDHGGFELKTKLYAYLEDRGYVVDDLGTYSEDSCDYPDYAFKLAEAVSAGEYERGILICGTGIGMSIAANKVRGIRAALVYDQYTAEMARKHNNANVLCLGGRTTDFELAKELVFIFLNTEFEGGRHERRVGKIAKYELKEE